MVIKVVVGEVDDFKDKGIRHFKTNTPKQTVYGRGKKLNKSKTQNQSEEKQNS